MQRMLTRRRSFRLPSWSVRKYSSRHNQQVLCGDVFGLHNNTLNLTLSKWLKSLGHTYILAKSSDHYLNALKTANVIISPLIHPSIQFNKPTFQSLSNLNLIISDNIEDIDLQAAWDRNITVLECNSSKIIDVAEEIVRKIFTLLSRKNGPEIDDEHLQFKDYFTGQNIGCVAGEKIGKLVLKRLSHYDTHLHFYDPHKSFDISKSHVKISDDYQYKNGATYHSSIEGMLPALDILTIVTAEGLNYRLLEKCKNSLYIIDCTNGTWMNEQEVVNAVNNAKLGGYFGNKLIVKDAMLSNFGSGFRSKDVIVKNETQCVKELLQMYLCGKPYPLNAVVIDPNRDIVGKQVNYIDRISDR